jgi:RsiW-degrading membrane proteinase PrsW (M82 family)
VVWGALAAETLAIVSHAGWDPLAANLLGDNAAAWLNALTAPPTEEILKGLGIVLIYLIARDEMDDLLDGAIYGLMVGLGFHVVEDIGHFIGSYGGTVGGVLDGFFVRVLAAGPFLHLAWSALIGMSIAYFVTRRVDRSLGQRVMVVAGALLLAMVGHGLWNSPLLWIGPDTLETFGDYVQIFFACVVKGIPFMVLIVVMLRLARAREHRWLRYALRDEVGLQALHQDELITLEHPKLRRGAVRRMARAYGPVAGKALRDLQRAHIQLAMIRTRTDDPNHPDLVAHRRYIEDLRGWLVQSTGHRGSTLAYPFQPPSAAPSPGP